MPIQEFTRPAAKFRAVRWAGHNLDEVAEILGDQLLDEANGVITVELSDGPGEMKVGWWAYRDQRGAGICSDATTVLQGWEPVA